MKRKFLLISFKNNLALYFLLFLFFNIILYSFINTFNKSIRFNSFNYSYNAHHFFKDERVSGGKFNLLRSLGQYDAQWYLKIATLGYPYKPPIFGLENKKEMSTLSYAFFPLYPLIISFANKLFNNIELSAFIVSNLIMVADFFSLYFLISKLYSKPLAIKTIFLLFLFPFSIFYRSYFAEGIQLLLLIWFVYFLIEGSLIRSSILLSLANILKGNFLLFNIYFFLNVFKLKNKSKISLNKMFILVFLTFFLLFLWILFCYKQTGNGLFFFKSFSLWYPAKYTYLLFIWPIYNLGMVLLFPLLPFHHFHFSQIETLVMITIFVLLIKSKKFLKPQLWWLSLIIWLTPLITKDLMSFTRYQTVSFPIFIYLANILKGYKYLLVVILFFVGLLITSLFFVNWYWIG